MFSSPSSKWKHTDPCSQVSPLEVAFVENSDPLATSVSADTLEVRVPALLIEFENVPVSDIDDDNDR